MLEVQKYLLSGKSFDDLNTELGINASFHPELPLVLLNYDQIESKPKTHPIVRECRALVLNTETKDLVAKSFNRFFNWGEVIEEMNRFNFDNFITNDKEDGSLLLIYWYQDRWMAHTRGSFNMKNRLNGTTFTWENLILEALGVSNLNELTLEKDITYICELCSLRNKVVRKYSKPVVYLLTAFKGLHELHWSEVDKLVTGNILRVGKRNFKSLDEILDHLRHSETHDPTYEGVVLFDGQDRWKVKSPTYLALHKMGENLYHPKYLLTHILAGNQDEVLLHYPEVEETYREYEANVNDAYQSVVSLWNQVKDIEDQKTFALAIQNKSLFNSVLFRLKREEDKSEKNLRRIWRDSEALILKVLFKNIPESAHQYKNNLE